MGGVSPQPPPVCSIHMNDATAATGQRRQCVGPHTSYRWRGERVIETIKCMRFTTHQLQVERRESHRDNQVYALTTHQLQVERRESHRANQVYALTTHQLQVERRERVIETIKWMGIIRRPWLTRASGGNLARTPDLHPYSLREVPWDF